MDFRLIQAKWALGELPAAELPRVAGEAMAAGRQGPALLELVSFHNPTIDQLRLGLVEEAFHEMGLEPLSETNAILRIARETAEAICLKQVSPDRGARTLWDLSVKGDDPVAALDPFVYWASEWEERPADRSFIEKAILSNARAFLDSIKG